MRQGKGGPICAGAYTRSKACVKEKVGLSARGLIRGVRRASRKGGPICAGAYTQSKACVKEKVGLSAGGLYAE